MGVKFGVLTINVGSGGCEKTGLSRGGPHARKRGEQRDIYKVECFGKLPLNE